MGFFGWLLWSIGALFVTLMLEILLAMAIYIYLNLNQPELFGTLVGWARDLLNMLIGGLRSNAPDLATQADVSLLGELGPKAFLLLVLGLFASGVIRFFAWMARRAIRSDY